MADEKKLTSAVDDASIAREREWNARVDWFLQSLVEMANNSPAAVSFGLTISVGGMLVSGELVSGQQYFEGFGIEFAGTFKDAKAAASVKESFSKLGGNIYSAGRKEDASAPKSPSGAASGPSYIHLKNARFFDPSGKPTASTQGTWWRGKLSAVDGFSLGVVKVDE